MSTLKSIIFFTLIFYAGFVGLLYFMQRGMMYLPDRALTPPADAGFPQAAEELLQTADGERVIVWHVPPTDGRPVALYFHGNGGALWMRASRFRALAAEGIGLVALSYRGYGGSSGSPSEDGLIADAMAAYEFAIERYPSERLALWGESLGTGVAIALAAERPVARLVLEAPFTSAADIAASVYPIVPVRLLMKDQFRSDERIARVTAPVLVIHGERDRVIPIRFGERLYELVQSPKRFVRLADGGHEGLDGHGAFDAARAFLLE